MRRPLEIEPFPNSWVLQAKCRQYARHKKPGWVKGPRDDDYWIGYIAELGAERLLKRSALIRGHDYWHLNEKEESFLPIDYLIKPPLTLGWQPRVNRAQRMWNGWGVDVKGMWIKKNSCEEVIEKWRGYDWFVERGNYENPALRHPRFFVFLWVDPTHGSPVYHEGSEGTNRLIIAGYLRHDELLKCERRRCSVPGAERQYQVDNFVVPLTMLHHPDDFLWEVYERWRV